MADPLDVFTRNAVAAALGRPVAVAVAVPIELEAAFDRLYSEPAQTARRGVLDEVVADAEPAEEDAERLKDLASEAPVIRLVNQLIARAVETPRLRHPYRAVRRPACACATASTACCARSRRRRRRLRSRDHLAHQDHGEAQHRRAPPAAGRPHPARGARPGDRLPRLDDADAPRREAWCCASSTARSLVARLRRRSASTADDAARRSASVLDRPHGIVLVTGPTGSGKTTTLYTGLTQLNTPDRKILTVEDPVEYQLAGINQIQVKPQIGLTFASAAALVPAPGSRRHHGRRDPRPGNRADRGAGGADRPSGALDPAHQRPRRR